MSLSAENLGMKEEAMDTDEPEVRLYFDQKKIDKRWTDIITEFFKRILLDNPHLTISERKTKVEARQIFIKEVMRNLCDTGQ